jgi:hypothetical protein
MQHNVSQYKDNQHVNKNVTVSITTLDTECYAEFCNAVCHIFYYFKEHHYAEYRYGAISMLQNVLKMSCHMFVKM